MEQYNFENLKFASVYLHLNIVEKKFENSMKQWAFSRLLLSSPLVKMFPYTTTISIFLIYHSLEPVLLIHA